MSEKSRIEWCDSTINVVYGCTPQTPGCDNCYAVRMAPRLGALTAGTYQDGAWTGKLNIFPERMLEACRWRKPRRIFVNSMGDLFHRVVSDITLDAVFRVMALCPQHEFVLLTKRPDRALHYIAQKDFEFAVGGLSREVSRLTGSPEARQAVRDALQVGGAVGWPMKNVILMATAENQPCFDRRAPEIAALAELDEGKV